MHKQINVMQTILGSGGAIGKLLARELTHYVDKVRLVARNPQKINDSDELVKADLTDARAVSEAVAGSEVAYLCVGLPYDLKVWQAQWPLVMKNVIDACVLHNCRLVFLDNVYMYAKSAIPHMTEESPMDPPSEKGKVRLQLVKMIMGAVNSGKLTALIARSADFYGPDVATSMLKAMVFDNYQKGKRAMWITDANKIHSFTFTPDAAKGVALLGNTADAFGEVWHLPTSAEKLNGKNFVKLTAIQMKRKATFYTLPKFMLRILGKFMPLLKELVEMQNQNDRDYFFDSSKFQKRFDWQPTRYAEGIKTCVAAMG